MTIQTGISKSLEITNRRSFLINGSLVMIGAGLGRKCVAKTFVSESVRTFEKPIVSVGLVTDLHYADKKPAGTRHYRESLEKLGVAADQFKKDKPDFIVELGDFIDSADALETEKAHLDRVNKDFVKLPGKKYYVLGNHCVHNLKKKEFLERVGQKESHFSFDAHGFHFIVLDSCFRNDGKPYERNNFDWTDPNIPTKQVDWLKEDLKSSKSKTIVFAHQRLDVENHYGVKNAKDVRKVLEQSKKVVAVFQGHSHANDYKSIGDIHYCTLVAMVEGSGRKNNAFSTMQIFENEVIKINGFAKQKEYEWSPKQPL